MTHYQCITQPFFIKELQPDGIFSGYASVFDVVDNHNDIILKGAFKNTIQNSRIEGTNIKLLWQHNTQEPVGVFSRITEDEVGLFVEGRLLLDLVKGKEIYSLIKAGAIDGLSIGYNPINFTYDQETAVRYISEIDLKEISLVTFPANEHAKIISVKNEEVTSDKELLALALSIEESMDSLF